MTIRINRIIIVIVNNVYITKMKGEKRIVEDFKITLEAARVNKGFSQKQVAELLGISPQTVCAWEKEPFKITIKDAYRLADLYCVPLGNLIFVL